MGRYFMLVIKVSRKLLKIALIIAIAACLGFISYRYIIINGGKYSRAEEPFIYRTDPADKGSLAAFLASAKAPAGGYKNIEIFDIAKEAVVKSFLPNPEVQKEAESYLKGITDICPKLNPIPKKGFMVKIPLDPPVQVENELVKASVDEVIIIFPEEEKPYLMLFDGEDRPLVFYFEGNTEEFTDKYIRYESLNIANPPPISPSRTVFMLLLLCNFQAVHKLGFEKLRPAFLIMPFIKSFFT